MRRTRLALRLEVLPALSVSSFIRPHFHNPGEFCLGVVVDYVEAKDLKSMSNAKMPPLRLRGLASMSERFRVSQRNNMSVAIASEGHEQKHASRVPGDGIVLQNGEKVTLYFDVKRGEQR